MSNGMHLMIPASEYAEMEAKIEKLEKALDKACKQLRFCSEYGFSVEECFRTVDRWKEWCME